MWFAAAWLAGLGWLSSAPAPRVFTVAGAESAAMSACWPGDDCAAATEQRLTGRCLTTFADGTIVLCQGRRLLAVGADGRVRDLAVASVGNLLDADVAPDGSVMAAGRHGVERVFSDGSTRTLVREDLEGYQLSIAAMDDGGAVLASPDGVQRIGADGAVAPLPQIDVVDVTRLPGTGVALAQGTRVLSLDGHRDTRIIAGGGRGFREGAPATRVALSGVKSVSAAADGTVLVSDARGVLRVDRSGRIWTVVASEPPGRFVAFGDRRSVDADGRPARAARVRDALRVHALGGSRAVVLTAVPGPYAVDTVRVALIEPSPDRLAIALPASNRTLLLHGRAEIVSTRRAVARVAVRRGRRVVASRRVVLAPGRTRIRLRVAASDRVHVLRVLGRTRDGAIATHQLAFIPGRTLAAAVVRRLENMVSLVNVSLESDMTVRCRRHTPRMFSCRSEQYDFSGDTVRDRAVLRLRADGLIGYHETTGKLAGRLNFVFEPLTYNPRPG